MNLSAGDRIWWEDPDDGISSGEYVIDAIISDEIVSISNESGSYAEVFISELRKI